MEEEAAKLAASHQDHSSAKKGLSFVSLVFVVLLVVLSIWCIVLSSRRYEEGISPSVLTVVALQFVVVAQQEPRNFKNLSLFFCIMWSVLSLLRHLY